MPIDINLLRKEKGGDPDYWRDVMRKRFRDVALVDRVVDQDQVRFAFMTQPPPCPLTTSAH